MTDCSRVIACLDASLSVGRFGSADWLGDNVAIFYEEVAKLIERRTGRNVPAPGRPQSGPLHGYIRSRLDILYDQMVHSSLSIDVLSQLARLHDMAVENTPVPVQADATDVILVDARERAIAVMAIDGITVIPTNLDPAHKNNLSLARNHLDRVLPRIWSNTGTLISSILVVEGPIPSRYVNECPGSIVVNMRTFEDVGLLAESLLHECLHQKMADIRVVTSMLSNDYREERSLRSRDVLVPWPNASSPRAWSVARCFAAFHVYVHLALFYAAARDTAPCERDSDLWPTRARERFATSFRRAEYLGSRMVSGLGDKALGTDGRIFRDEMATALLALESIDGGLSETLDQTARYKIAS